MGTDGENLDPSGRELARLLAELVRAGYSLTIQMLPNEWGAVTTGEIIFERVLQTEPARTLREDMEALEP